MNSDQTAMLLNVDDSNASKLIFSLHGRSRPDDVASMLQAVQSRLKTSKNKNCEVIFDLSEVHPLYNTVGRWLDIAKQYSELPSQHKFCIRLSEALYRELSITEEDLPESSSKKLSLGNLRIELTPEKLSQAHSMASHNINASSPMELPSQSPVLLHRWPGKIRTINKDVVTISLFTGPEDEDEVLGELFRTQFPVNNITVGQTFHYVSQVSNPGETRVLIEMIEPKVISDNRLLDLYQKSKSLFPEDV